MGKEFGIFAGIGLLVFLCYAGMGLYEYLANKNKCANDEEDED